MAYNFYPNLYPYGYMGMNQQQPQQQPQQLQNGGFISVQSEDEARAYPIAPGNSITFIDTSAPYCYTKTSFSQLDRPRFEKYRLVKEEDLPQKKDEPKTPDDMQDIRGRVDEIGGGLDSIIERVAKIEEKIKAFDKKSKDEEKKK